MKVMKKILVLFCCSFVTFSWVQNYNEGVLHGEFSVSETKKVRFSKGNLQYCPKTEKWRLADRQWSVVGEDNNNLTNASFSGWIDLFAWGADDTITGISALKDWGEKVTKKGKANSWRTLSAKEWNYLLSREGKCNVGNVEGVNGLILLPDDFKSPGQKFWLSKWGWMSNKYTAEQWMEMESAGAVFLPAAGCFFMTVVDLNERGEYWSSSDGDCEGTRSALRIHFDSQGTDEVWNEHCTFCLPKVARVSVRLVQDVLK
jgi:hypothetical protein